MRWFRRKPKQAPRRHPLFDCHPWSTLEALAYDIAANKDAGDGWQMHRLAGIGEFSITVMNAAGEWVGEAVFDKKLGKFFRVQREEVAE